MSPDRHHEDERLEQVDAEIDRLEEAIAPMKERLAQLRRLRAAIVAGRASLATRRQKVAERDAAIVAAAIRRRDRASFEWQPYDWVKRLAVEHRIDVRTVRRILRRAGVNATG